MTLHFKMYLRYITVPMCKVISIKVSGSVNGNLHQINGHHNQAESTVQGEEPRDVVEMILAWIPHTSRVHSSTVNKALTPSGSKEKREKVCVLSFYLFCRKYVLNFL